MPSIFDPILRAQRRDRAHRHGAVLFLHERAFADILERLSLIERKFDTALLVGCPDPHWPERLAAKAAQVTAIDPGREFASAARGRQLDAEVLDVAPSSQQLVVAVGTLDTIDDLPGALARLRFALEPGGLLIGAIAGSDSLPLLRAAMAAADALSGQARAHIHPRIDPASLTRLLDDCGLSMPVVDVDRVRVRYAGLWSLVSDLRGMAATNILLRRPRVPIGRAALAAAEDFISGKAAPDGRVEERFDILHFMGWAPATGPNRN